MADPLGNWKKLLKNLSEAGDYEARVGIQGEKAAQPHEGGELTNVEIAAVHEFNGPQDKPPGRAFIRPPMYEKEDYWRNRLAMILKDVIEKGGNPKQAYRQVGEEYRKAIIDRVNAGIAPPLADSTINRRKGQNTEAKRAKREAQGNMDVTPLIDTGIMKGAISVDVVKK